MAVRMRVNKDKESKCKLCNTPYMYTPEMYDLQLANDESGKSVVFNLCKKCTDEIFHKTLKASCNYNAKVKTKEDMQRVRLTNNKEMLKEENNEESVKINNEPVVRNKKKRRK